MTRVWPRQSTNPSPLLSFTRVTGDRSTTPNHSVNAVSMPVTVLSPSARSAAPLEVSALGPGRVLGHLDEREPEVGYALEQSLKL